jgi:microcystin-dependent protein
MSQPFIGEIRLGGWNFAPQGWALCDGQLLPISQYAPLFQLIGTTYGGDGVNTFGLPNLQSRIPVHQGTSPNGIPYVIGELAGTETVTLNTNQIPAHSHNLAAQSGAGAQPSPAGGLWANSSLNQYSAGTPTAQMAPTSLQNFGGSQPHDNLPPYQVVNYIIALFGIFPTQG